MGDEGLHLVFHADPTPPADLGGDFDARLEDIGELRLENLRVVGDAAPGDDRTRVDELTLTWPGPDPEVWFEDAPPGMYSVVLATLTRYDLSGTVVVDGVTRDFDIEDEQTAITLSIALPDVTLNAGEIVTIDLDVALADLVREIRWDEITPDEEGKLELEGGDPQAGSVESQLGDAFSVASAGPS